MNFHANKVMAVYFDGAFHGYVRDERQLDRAYDIGNRGLRDVRAFAVAVGEDDSHNTILARIALDAVNRNGGDEKALAKAQDDLVRAEAAAGPSWDDRVPGGF